MVDADLLNYLEEQVAWLRSEVERKGQLIEMLVTKLCETIDTEPEDEPVHSVRQTL